jgi:hypothetical protein
VSLSRPPNSSVVEVLITGLALSLPDVQLSSLLTSFKGRFCSTPENPESVGIAKGESQKSTTITSDNGNAYGADTEERYISQAMIVKRILSIRAVSKSRRGKDDAAQTALDREVFCRGNWPIRVQGQPQKSALVDECRRE